MDLRNDAIAVIVGGSPAPGINAVISAIVLEAFHSNYRAFGIQQGWKRIREGHTDEETVMRFQLADVTNIHGTGGSILQTSKAQLGSKQEIDNVMRALEHLQVKYLISIGGTDTMKSAALLSAAARHDGVDIHVVHIPKTIFNDLPLPSSACTFGFTTARDTGANIVRNLYMDSKTTQRFYIITVMGQKAGHLALGIGKVSAATLTVIPEEFLTLENTNAASSASAASAEAPQSPLVVSTPGYHSQTSSFKFSLLCDILEASVIKRRAQKKNYGVAIITEGLVNLMPPSDIETLFGGKVETGHVELGRKTCQELRRRFLSRGIEITFADRYMGQELRCANPSGTDIELARDLGYGAFKLITQSKADCMITIKGGIVFPIPFEQAIDAETGFAKIRQVDMNALSTEVAQKYMIRLRAEDVQDPANVALLAEAAKMTPPEFLKKFHQVIQLNPF